MQRISEAPPSKMYDRPRTNSLTGKAAAADYISVIDAVGRRDQVRVLIDGMTAANELGISNPVPGQVIVHTDGRLRPIALDNLTLQFRLTAPSKLYWAGRPCGQFRLCIGCATRGNMQTQASRK